MTIEELKEQVKADLPKETLDELKNLKEEDLVQTHFGLGMYIRNKYNIWQSDFTEPVLDDDTEYQFRIHPDDVSGRIIEMIWKDLQNNKDKDYQHDNS
jgi:hypothetical protein